MIRPAPWNVPHPGTLRDAIRYLDPEWIDDAKLGEGALIGMVSAIMALKGMNWERAVATIIENMPRDMEPSIRRVPESWREQWTEIIEKF